VGQVERLVGEGGTLMALGAAAELPIHYFSLPVRNVVSGDGEAGEPAASTAFYSPGSLLRVKVDTTHPLAFGMPADAIVFSSGGEAFEITLAPAYNQGDREVHGVASFVTKDLLAS